MCFLITSSLSTREHDLMELHKHDWPSRAMVRKVASVPLFFFTVLEITTHNYHIHYIYYGVLTIISLFDWSRELIRFNPNLCNWNTSRSINNGNLSKVCSFSRNFMAVKKKKIGKILLCTFELCAHYVQRQSGKPIYAGLTPKEFAIINKFPMSE